MTISGLILLAFLGFNNTASGWAECGHHIISLLAFDLLEADEQSKLLKLLAAHPRYEQDFAPPRGISGDARIRRWRIGRAGYWPDVARRQREYHRSTWHYQLAATLIVGDSEKCQVPPAPGPCPESATLKTQELHIAQAVTLCRRVMADQQAPADDRAVALSWLAHLVADAHQPCHGGSLFASGCFPDGDRGANSIPIKQGYNMHALWDNLLGRQFDEGDVRRRRAGIAMDAELMQAGRMAASRQNGLNALTWLEESREFGRSHVYTPNVLEAVSAVSRGLTDKVPTTDLSEDYLEQAGALARQRAALAAWRLAEVWREGLAE